MLERTTGRALPVINRAVDMAPAVQACCGACRTCMTTNIFSLVAAGGGALIAYAARFLKRRT